MTNSKSHTGFWLIPTSMTLNDLERHDNSPYFAFFSRNSIAFLANYVRVIKDRPIMSIKYLSPSSSLPLLAITNALCSVFSLRYLSYLFTDNYWLQVYSTQLQLHCKLNSHKGNMTTILGLPFSKICSNVVQCGKRNRHPSLTEWHRYRPQL